LLRIRVPGTAIRYAIPVGVLYWTWVETAASMDIIVEFYLLPAEYPMACAVTAALALAMLGWIAMRGGDAVRRDTASLA